MKNYVATLSLFAMLALPSAARSQEPDTLSTERLDDVTVTARRSGTTSLSGAVAGFRMNQDELFRAACCNLGESFVNNPSVDVSYSDATTGAKQIRLLGLAGTYVQMLAENLPAFRGAAQPYALDYVPGPWMSAIQVSKGAASVRNGYESITGQIDVEYLKPEDEQGVTVNVYGDTQARLEANADANLHLNPRLNSELLLHYQDSWSHHDINHDGFLDRPNIKQYNLQNRWDYLGRTYIFHGGFGVLKEDRNGGQDRHTATSHTHRPYTTSLSTDRYEAYMKHAFVLDRDHGTNIALMASGAIHQLDGAYGMKAYDLDEKDLYAQLMFETHFSERHELSAGLSLSHDRQTDKVTLGNDNLIVYAPGKFRESTPGIYGQYTFDLDSKLIAMAGLRLDHSSLYGTFLTPRIHIKYTPVNLLSLRIAAGKGYRTPRPLPENQYLLASGRDLHVEADMKQEEAWNCGASAMLTVPVADRVLKVNAEYFYTHFINQMVVDYETKADVLRRSIAIHNLNGRSFSHTFQIDATYPAFDGFTLTAACRLNNVRQTMGGDLSYKPGNHFSIEGGTLRERPLTNRFKALLTASYKTPLELWQFDATLQVNGGGRLPYGCEELSPRGNGRFPAYPQLSAQVTRWFRHCSVYIGGENLTGFRQKNIILGADDPWSNAFEPTIVWGPVHGAMAYAGIRVNFGRL